MQSIKFALSSVGLAGAVFAVVVSLSCLAAVFAVVASAPSELGPVLAGVKASPVARAVAGKAPA
jgi:hypothetical protein